MSGPTNKARKKPCDACPFRRDSLPGWVGDSTPEEFIQTMRADVPMPCHKTLDYDDPDWKQLWETGEEGLLCAGALTFFANTSKLSRDRNRPRLPKDHVNVFSNVIEFMQYHAEDTGSPTPPTPKKNSKEELQAITQKMRNTSNRVYLLLQSCEVHAFIEFNGLMQKYVDLCQRAADAGEDFTMYNTHNDKSFEVHGHDIEYLAEKFDCIFGPLFRKEPALWKLFKETLGLP